MRSSSWVAVDTGAMQQYNATRILSDVGLQLKCGIRESPVHSFVSTAKARVSRARTEDKVAGFEVDLGELESLCLQPSESGLVEPVPGLDLLACLQAGQCWIVQY